LKNRRIHRTEESASIHLAGHDVAYTLKRSSARRTLALGLRDGGRVVVNAPFRLPRGHIDGFLRQHADWLLQRLLRQPEPMIWRDGMVLPLLGRELRLVHRGLAGPMPSQLSLFDQDVGQDAESPVLEGDRLICPGGRGSLEARVMLWYRQQAGIWLDQRLEHLCREQGIAQPAWRLSNARTRWGSLSPAGVVSLNWRLIKASPEEIDYVICHELAHFRQRNHSAAFWAEVARLCPGHESARRRLKEHGPHYFEF